MNGNEIGQRVGTVTIRKLGNNGEFSNTLNDSFSIIGLFRLTMMKNDPIIGLSFFYAKYGKNLFLRNGLEILDFTN